MEVKIGPEAKASMKVIDAKLVLAVEYTGTQASAGVSVSFDVDQFADMLKNAIPGKIDDAIIDVLKIALKAV